MTIFNLYANISKQRTDKNAMTKRVDCRTSYREFPKAERNRENAAEHGFRAAYRTLSNRGKDLA
ncbi:hypothetical protein D3Z53_21315 [Lachnospiraceae bacterium]|nr:hypothetical protein [Lachnospiraceae bacterium]